MGYVNYNETKLTHKKRLDFNKKNTVFMGVDQSFSNTGIVVMKKENIVFATSISTNSKEFLEDRITKITDCIIDNINEYNVKHVNIEGLSFSSSQASGRQLAGLFFYIIIILKQNNITYSIIPPSSLKMFATGSGKAKKDDMLNHLDNKSIEILEQFTKIKHTAKKFEDIVDAYYLSKYFYNDNIQ